MTGQEKRKLLLRQAVKKTAPKYPKAVHEMASNIVSLMQTRKVAQDDTLYQAYQYLAEVYGVLVGVEFMDDDANKDCLSVEALQKMYEMEPPKK